MVRDIRELLKVMVSRKASDLHIGANTPLMLRIDENLVPLDDTVLSGDESKDLTYSILSKDQIQKFEKELELDFSFSIEKVSRFRMNVFKQRSMSLRNQDHSLRDNGI
jgi:twitching motility protein PilT